MKKVLRTAAGIAAAVLLGCLTVGAAPETAAESAVLLDAESGRVLWAKNEASPALIASTTKIMTGYLIAQSGDLQKEVVTPKQAVGTEGSSLYLKENEVLTREALLYGLMLESGNDAAVALAADHSGSEAAFVREMNEKAANLGLCGTHYANPHGLDSDDNRSTAYDLALLTSHALRNEVFRKVVSSRFAVFGNRTFCNHNKLLWRYDGAIGVKTGFTKAAGRILVSAAERDGRTLIAVTLNDRRDWLDHAQLLDYGFSHYRPTVLLCASEPLCAVDGAGGVKLLVRAGRGFSYPICDSDTVRLRFFLPRTVSFPVHVGDTMGAVFVTVNGKVLTAVPLCWAGEFQNPGGAACEGAPAKDPFALRAGFAP